MKFHILKEVGLFIHLVLQSFLEGECLTLASALSYSTLLTFVPFLMTIFFIVQLLPIYDSLGINLQQFIILNFVPSFGEQILEYVELFERQAQALPRLSFISLGITVMILLITVENTLNTSWKLVRNRTISVSIIVNWLLLLLGPFLLLISILMSSMFASLDWLNEWLDMVQVITKSLSISLIPFGLSILSFSLLYYIVPHCKILFLHALSGGLVAAILFEMAKKIVGIYFHYVQTYSVVYGALAALPFLMVWLYIVWIIFFLGGHVVNVLRQYSELKKKYRPLLSFL